MCQDSGLVMPTFLSQSFERIHTTLVVGYWKHPAVFTQSTVFFHNLLGIIKQLDVGFRSCLLSMDNNPFIFIEKFLDVLFLRLYRSMKARPVKQQNRNKSRTILIFFLVIGVSINR